MSPEKIERMTFKERRWWLERLVKQFKTESEAMRSKK